MMKQILILLFVLIPASASTQISVRYTSAKRTYYHHGDTIGMTVMMRLSPQSCLDGMKKTYIYFSNCENVSDAPWRQSRNKIFYREMLVKVAGNAGEKAKMTITRDTDKDSFFRQESWMIK